MSSSGTERWKALDFGPPAPDVVETEDPVLLDYLDEGQVAVVTLNRPHADNAITTEMGALLTEVVETIAVRTAVRVVILTGAGERAFSVGSDLRQRKSMTKEDWLRQRQAFDRTLYTVRQLRKPIFAAVNGIAYGGGCELAQSTDFIIASETATFGQPEAMLGLAAGGGSPALLPRLLPRGKALQMLLTGDPVPAQEAYRLGMVNELHPPAVEPSEASDASGEGEAEGSALSDPVDLSALAVSLPLLSVFRFPLALSDASDEGVADVSSDEVQRSPRARRTPRCPGRRRAAPRPGRARRSPSSWPTPAAPCHPGSSPRPLSAASGWRGRRAPRTPCRRRPTRCPPRAAGRRSSRCRGRHSTCHRSRTRRPGPRSSASAACAPPALSSGMAMADPVTPAATTMAGA